MKELRIICAIAAIIILFLIIYFQYTDSVRESYDPMLDKLKQRVTPMFDGRVYYTGDLENVDTSNVLDSVRLYKSDKSYTINKEKVYMCLKDEDNTYYSMNMLTYVLLHEIAHVLCDEIGHTEKFHRIFEQLISKATDMGIYNPSIPIVQDYCQYS